MGMAGVSNSIIGFLIVTSALVFILGAVSSLVLRVLKIKGRPKFFIYALLFIIPLAYPVKTLFPGPIEVHVPLSEKIFNIELFSGIVSSPPAGMAFIHPAKGEEAASTGNRASRGNSVSGLQETTTEFLVNWKLTATLVWFTVFLYFLIRLAAKIYNANRVSAFLEPVTDSRVLDLLRACMVETGLHRMPGLSALDQLPSPMAMGFLKPRILLPKRLLRPEFREGLRFALLHELKHVHQHHNWWLLVESVIGAAYFFHPIILWAKKRIHEELECICDRHVVKITNKSVSYADFLLHEIWQQVREKDHVPALPFISDKTKTTNRVRCILDNKKMTLFSKIRNLAALCVVSFSFVSLLLCNVAPSAENTDRMPKELISITADNQKHVSVHTRTHETEKGVTHPIERTEVRHVDDSLSVPSRKRLPRDDSTVLPYTAALNTGAGAQKNDTFMSPRERPGYENLPERKNPDILMDEAGIPAGEKSGRKSISDTVRPAAESVFYIESESMIVLAQNGSFMEFAPDMAPVAETGETEFSRRKALFHMQQGTEHYKQGRFDEAVDFYGKAIALDPSLAAAYNNRGSVYRAQGQIGKAVSDYTKAIELKPMFAAAYANRGDAHYRMLRYHNAIFDFSKAIALDSGNADNYYLRGSIYYLTGNIDKAVSDYNRAIALNPEYITKMPAGITPDPKQGDTNYASYAEESLKWHHGSLPSSYWDMAKGKAAGGRIVTPYQIRKKRI